MKPPVFKSREGGMSTNWGKYSSARHTRGCGPQPPSNYGVVKLGVAAVRGVEGLSVVHTPDEDRNNRAHTDVHGLEGSPLEVNSRRALLFAAIDPTWEIAPSDPG